MVRLGLPHSGESHVDSVIERLANVGIVGDGAHQRHAAGVSCINAVADQLRGVHHKACGNALVETVPLEIARGVADFHQLGGRLGVEAAFLAQNGGFEPGLGVVEIEGGEALFGGLLQILHQRLIARVIRNHQLKIGMRLNQLALLVERQGAAMVGQRVDDHGGVLTRLDNFVEVADRADARGGGQRPIEPARAAAFEQITSDQIARRHVFIAGHGDERLAQPPRHVLDKARFAASRRPLDHDRQAIAVGGLKQGHLAALRLVIGLCLNPVLLRVNAHASTSKTTRPRETGGAETFKNDVVRSGLLVDAQFVAPAREELVGIAREGFECARELYVLLGVLDRIGSGLPALIGLAQRLGASCRRVDMAVGAAARGVDHVAVAQVLEEAGQAQRVHAAGNDGGGGLHAVPLLIIDRALALVALDHVGDVAVVALAFHLAVTHGADVDAGGALQAAHLGQHKGGVAALGTGRGDGAVTRTVIVQVLVRILATRGGDHAGAAHVAVHQEGQLVSIGTEDFQREVRAGAHLVIVVRGDVHGEQLGLASLVLRAFHGVVDQRNHLFHRGEYLIALRLVVLDEIAPQPELIGRLGKWLRAQTQLGLDDGAGDIAAVLDRPTQNAPQVGDVGGRAVEHLDRALGHIEIDHLAVLDIAHALVVADHQREEGHDHEAAVDHIPIEQFDRIGDAHVFRGFIDEINQGIDPLGEIVRRADFHIGAGGRFGRKVRRRRQIVIARFGLHFVGNKDVLATGDQIRFLEIEIGVAAGLIVSHVVPLCVGLCRPGGLKKINYRIA